MSERRICRVPDQHRSTQRKVPRGADDEQALTEDIIALAKQYGRYGYRRVTALLCQSGFAQHAGEGEAAELAALIGIEDFRLAEAR